MERGRQVFITTLTRPERYYSININEYTGKSMAIDFEKDSEILKALGHPVRLKIVAGLIESDGCNVTKMVAQLGIPQSTVSQHLATLRHAKVLVCQKDGTKICYHLADRRITGLVKALKG